jgi:hypothetical protein
VDHTRFGGRGDKLNLFFVPAYRIVIIVMRSGIGGGVEGIEVSEIIGIGKEESGTEGLVGEKKLEQERG